MMLDTVFAILFYALIGIYLFKNRKNVQREAKIIFLVRTKRAVGFIKKWGEKFDVFWKVFGTVGVVLGVSVMILVSALFIDNSLKMFSAPSEAAKTYLVIPGVQLPGSPIFIPFIAGILSILILAVIHEFAHGFVAAAERVNLKSVGWGLFLFFPLAFVEPDEKDMKRISPMARMRIFGAGSAANITASIIFALILYQIIAPAMTPLIEFDGIQIVQVNPESGAMEAGVEPNLLVTGINGQEVKNMSQAIEFLSVVKPGETVTLLGNDSKTYSVVSSADSNNSSRAIMGVTFSQHWSFKEENMTSTVLFSLQTFFFWLANLNLMVGIMNLLPIIILDGGKIFAEILGYKLPEKQVWKIVVGVSNILVVLLVFNIVGSYLI